MAKNEGEIHSITDAQPSLTVDQRARQIRYFYSMMFRTACFIATVFLPSPWRWFTLAGAVVLPYIAVIVANAGRETILRPESFGRVGRRAIGGSVSKAGINSTIEHGTKEPN
jgi:predicted tellurium resistance membrane protein TerC